jgi:hypothetical protein
MGEYGVHEEEKCPDFKFYTTGLAIRQYLMDMGEGSPYDFYKCFKKFKPTVSYKNVAYYFYLLHRAGLIQRVRSEPSSRGGFDKSIYRIVPGKEDDPGWLHPQQIFYPETRLGGRRYRRIKEEVELGRE